MLKKILNVKSGTVLSIPIQVGEPMQREGQNYPLFMHLRGWSGPLFYVRNSCLNFF